MPRAIARKVPIRVPVAVEWQDNGNAVLVYRKNFNRLERWISRRFGGVAEIRRPLDQKGTMVWKMSDGRHTVGEICRAMHKRYGEGMEPVGPRVWTFIRMLEDRNIVLVLGKKVPLRKKGADVGGASGDGPEVPEGSGGHPRSEGATDEGRADGGDGA